jgi:hypothetical protein
MKIFKIKNEKDFQLKIKSLLRNIYLKRNFFNYKMKKIMVITNTNMFLFTSIKMKIKLKNK